MVLHQNQTRIAFRNKQNVTQTLNAHISETRQDIEISSTYLESVTKYTSDRCSCVIL